MKILSPRVHGYLDYMVVALLFLAPSLFGFTGIAATICYVLAPVQLVMSLLTAYPLGVAKMIPFPVHGGVELVTSIGLIAAPWLFGFSAFDAARNFFLVAGIGLGLVYLVTNYAAARTTTTTHISV
jgi:hypothetical protein